MMYFVVNFRFLDRALTAPQLIIGVYYQGLIDSYGEALDTTFKLCHTPESAV